MAMPKAIRSCWQCWRATAGSAVGSAVVSSRQKASCYFYLLLLLLLLLLCFLLFCYNSLLIIYSRFVVSVVNGRFLLLLLLLLLCLCVDMFYVIYAAVALQLLLLQFVVEVWYWYIVYSLCTCHTLFVVSSLLCACFLCFLPFCFFPFAFWSLTSPVSCLSLTCARALTLFSRTALTCSLCQLVFDLPCSHFPALSLSLSRAPIHNVGWSHTHAERTCTL